MTKWGLFQFKKSCAEINIIEQVFLLGLYSSMHHSTTPPTVSVPLMDSGRISACFHSPLSSNIVMTPGIRQNLLTQLNQQCQWDKQWLGKMWTAAKDVCVCVCARCNYIIISLTPQGNDSELICEATYSVSLVCNCQHSEMYPKQRASRTEMTHLAGIRQTSA